MADKKKFRLKHITVSDIHASTASKADQEVTADTRRTAKMANFGIIYGVSGDGRKAVGRAKRP